MKIVFTDRLSLTGNQCGLLFKTHTHTHTHFSLSLFSFYLTTSCLTLELHCWVVTCVGIVSIPGSHHRHSFLLTLNLLLFPTVWPHHTALGQHGNKGRFFATCWLCKSLQHVFQAGARGVHHSATSQLLLELSAVPIIAWHHHPYLFSWKFIIYDTSSFLPPGTWMLLSCQSEIWLGSCYLSCFFEVSFLQVPF